MEAVMTNMNSNVLQLREMLSSSPLLFPLEWNRLSKQVVFIGLKEADYQQASFLDDRVDQVGAVKGLVPFELISELPQLRAKRCNFIFHISHCGSTLLSRLLGTHPHCFSVREPKILRSFDSQDETEIQWLFRLLARTFHPEQTSLIKATSYVSQYASTWMSKLPESKAILLSIGIADFLACVLDGSIVDIENHLPSRIKRLTNLGIQFDQPTSGLRIGQATALSWLCEMLTIESIADRFPDRTLRVRFENLLNHPDACIDKIAEFVPFPRPYPIWSEQASWKEYAKRPGVFYDKHMRSLLLEQAGERFAEEIQDGIEWLRSLNDPRVAKILEGELEADPRSCR
jgi:hypothetical protein